MSNDKTKNQTGSNKSGSSVETEPKNKGKHPQVNPWAAGAIEQAPLSDEELLGRVLNIAPGAQPINGTPSDLASSNIDEADAAAIKAVTSDSPVWNQLDPWDRTEIANYLIELAMDNKEHLNSLLTQLKLHLDKPAFKDALLSLSRPATSFLNAMQPAPDAFVQRDRLFIIDVNVTRDTLASDKRSWWQPITDPSQRLIADAVLHYKQHGREGTSFCSITK